MKSKKVTMLVAALVVAVVAAAGIGYATTYTAKTTNSDNTLGSTYLTIEQGATGKYTENFLTKIYFDTETEKAADAQTATTTYTPVYEYDNTYTASTSGTYALISKVITITIGHKDNGQASGTLIVEATEGFTKATGFTYDMVIKTGSSGVAGGTAGTFTDADPDTGAKAKWTFTVDLPQAANETKVYSIALFVKGSTTNSTDAAAIGFVGDTTAQVKSKFTFTVSAAVTNS